MLLTNRRRLLASMLRTPYRGESYTGRGKRRGGARRKEKMGCRSGARSFDVSVEAGGRHEKADCFRVRDDGRGDAGAGRQGRGSGWRVRARRVDDALLA